MFAGHDTTTSGKFACICYLQVVRLIANELSITSIYEYLCHLILHFRSENFCKALSFALSFITEHNEVKTKCLTEIQHVCMSNGQLDMSSDNIKRLTYLEACIKETLRLRSFLHKLITNWYNRIND